jgi:hypothetical protein
VVLHTNLGRAPLSAAARRAVAAAAGYATVEYDLAAGTRGSRTAHVGDLAAELCGTEAATVVNNGAAALLLVLAAVAGSGEVVVSRGELIEIGGSFRLPDVMAVSGARLREVGTTNRTRLADYREAVGPTPAAAQGAPVQLPAGRVHEDVEVAELAALAAETGVPVAYDVGSGLIRDAGDGRSRCWPTSRRSTRRCGRRRPGRVLRRQAARRAAGRASSPAARSWCAAAPGTRWPGRCGSTSCSGRARGHAPCPPARGVPTDVPTIAMLTADVAELTSGPRP